MNKQQDHIFYTIPIMINLQDLSTTQRVAQKLAKAIRQFRHARNAKNLVITLTGDLGTGKTTLVKYILQELGVADNIKSPTYTIVEPYHVDTLLIYHFDLYRLAAASEWTELGFDEYLQHNNTISFIEWAEKVPNLLQLADWQINLSIDNNNNRHMEITAKSTQQNGVV